MQTGPLKTISRASAAETLARLIQSKALRTHRFVRECSIGPFIVEFVCLERGVGVELRATEMPTIREQARLTLLAELGYRVLQFREREILARPEWVLEMLQRALGEER
jgi:primosomal protein N' (replication factor Y)